MYVCMYAVAAITIHFDWLMLTSPANSAAAAAIMLGFDWLKKGGSCATIKTSLNSIMHLLSAIQHRNIIMATLLSDTENMPSDREDPSENPADPPTNQEVNPPALDPPPAPVRPGRRNKVRIVYYPFQHNAPGATNHRN